MGSNVPPITPTRRAVTPAHDPDRFAHLGPRQSAGGVRRHPRPKAEPLVQLVHDLVLRHGVRLVRLATHNELRHRLTLVDDEQIVRGQLGAAEHYCLHLARVDVHPAADDQVGAPLGDVDVAGGIEAPEITAVVPAVAKGRRGGVRVAPVAGHQRRRAHD